MTTPVPPPPTAADLLRQAQRRSLLAEQVQLLLGVLDAALSTLPDRLAAADWGTTPLTQAIDALAEAAVDGLPDLDTLTWVDEQLQCVQAAAEAAEHLGARVAEVGATGTTEAFLTGGSPTHAGPMDKTAIDPEVADLVAQYDAVARSEPWTRSLDLLHQAIDRDLRELGVDIDGYLAEVVRRARQVRDEGRQPRYLTLTTYLTRQQTHAAEAQTIEDRLAAMLLDNLDRTGHRDAVLALVREDQGPEVLDHVLQAAARGRAHRNIR